MWRMSHAWLGATGGRPTVELLLAPDDERLPLPLGVDDSYAFDDGLARAGWVAIRVGYQMVALHDGDLLHSTRLPDCWSVVPAADHGLVLISRYSGRSRPAGEPQTTELIDSTGQVLRSVTADVWGVVGELESGLIVARDSLVSWTGERQRLPAPGQAHAVCSARFVVMTDPDSGAPPVVRVVDTLTGLEQSCPLMPPAQVLVIGCYDATASSVAFPQPDGDVLVVTSSGVPRWLHVEIARPSVVWLDSDHLAVIGERKHCVVDVRTGVSSPLEGVPRRAFPRVDVSGRFDPEQLRGALRPAWKGRIPDREREVHVERARQRIRIAAEQAAIPADALLALSAPAIRLRSCVAPKRVAVGISRFGGEPDLPPKRDWPMSRGVPMAFLAQFRCEELNAALPAAVLPTDGMLVVFVGLEADGGFPPTPDSVHAEVIPTRGLRRRPWPSDLADELRFAVALAVSEPTLTLPDWPMLEEIASPDEAEELLRAVRTPGSAHQLLGHPSTIQGSPPPDGGRLLMQIDSDPLLGTVFGDGGRLHIWAPIAGSPFSALEECIVELDSY
jgi:hypothetical protein